MAVELATCPRCGDELPVDEFAKDPSKASGRKSYCKRCDNARSRRYYRRNLDISRAKRRLRGRQRRADQGDGAGFSDAPPGHITAPLAAREIPAEGVCEDCGAEFEPNTHGRPRRFCPDCSTPAASAKRWRAEHPEAYEPVPRREAVCLGCGEPFVPTNGRQRYCKPSHRPTGDRGAKVTVSCAWCDRPFEARARDRARGGGRFCCKSHALQARNSPAVAA